MKISFSPKVFGAILWSIAIGLGGTWYYLYTLPNTVRADLEKSGVVLLNSENDYRGIFQDQKEEIEKISELKNILKDNEEQASKQINKWCQVELNKRPASSKVPETHRKHVINLCSTVGIKTNRGHLAQLQKSNWIEDKAEDKEKLYGIIFSIYRFYPEFLNWLTKGKGGLTSATQISEGRPKLQDKCTNSLKSPYSKDTDKKTLEYISWWCSELPYKTVKERLDIREEGWDFEQDPDKISSLWSQSKTIKKFVNNGVDTEGELKPQQYLDWCKKILSKELSEENIYQEEYVAAKIACRAYQ